MFFLFQDSLIDQTLPHSPSTSWLLFPLIVVACIRVFVYYMYLHTHTCVCSPKYYNLFDLCAATYMYVFRAECSPQGKTASRSPELYSVACSPLCTVEALWAFPYPCWCHPVQLMFGQLCWWDFMCVASGSTRRHKLRAVSLVLWLLQSFHHLSGRVPWALGASSVL